jgi:tetratricopeptide (TPR) repeat protein
MDQAQRIGDETNPGAALLYRTRQVEMLIAEGRVEEAISTQRAVLEKLPDFLNFQSVFVNALDNLLMALEARGEVVGKIEPLRMRLFFATDLEERGPRMAERAACLKAAGRHEEAVEEITGLLDLLAAKKKRLFQFQEDRALVKVLRDAAYDLAAVYETMGLSPEEGLRQAWHATDLFSPKPARLLFRYFFLTRSGMLHRGLDVIEFALMDEKDSLLLLECKAECYHLLDEMQKLKDLYSVIVRSYAIQGVDMEARCAALFAVAYEDRDNLEVILELARMKSYQHKFDHSLNILQEALKTHPRAAALHRMAALVHRLDGDPRASRAALEQALIVDPGDFRASLALKHLKAHTGIDAIREKGGPRGP